MSYAVSYATNIKVTHRTTMYPVELHCGMEKSTSKSKNTSHKKLNVDVKEYRPQRTAAVVAGMRTRDIVAEQLDE